MDVAHLLFAAATQDQKQRYDFASSLGALASFMEGAVPEQLFGRPYGQGISAVRLLNAANEQGIPIYAIDQQNAAAIVPTLQIGSDTRLDIENAIAAGKMVIISESAPAHLNYQGIGYIVKDTIDGTGAYLIDGGINGGALADCACEKVKVPKVDYVTYIIATIIILAILAALIAGSGGLGLGGLAAGSTAFFAFLKDLLLLFGIPALFFPLNAQASSQTPPTCCITSECGKPDLFRGRNGGSPELENIRLNRPPHRDDVGYTLLDTSLIIPFRTTCSNVTPVLASAIEVVAGSGGASLDEVAAEAAQYGSLWKLPKDSFPPPQLCLIKDGRTHWSLTPRTNMPYSDFCDALRGANGLFIPQ